MKRIHILLLLPALASLGWCGSSPAIVHSGQALGHVSGAARESAAAAAHGLKAPARLVAGAASVPLWMSGAVANGSAQAAKAVGTGTDATAERLWDFATDGAAGRPPLSKTSGLPAPARPAPAPTAEPSPAEALRLTTRT